ncbi:MAG: tRNA (adenosine(37)-N6)-dimethylallyltransferase MiaA [Candidatus Taylorbacteria bacterium]|nr:tRNA (adenosine(37)-N6)-dimethylallyltransferase MiaA [Candidatus Taylorbacteria bacterium]
MKNKVVVILGPTAVGKSDTAVTLSKRLKCAEVISADSRQVYTGLNIGSGKITKKEMQGVIHHGLDIVSPTRKKAYSVAEFKEYADKKITEISKRKNLPILCGGTGFYIDAVIDGMVLPEVPPNLPLRAKLSTYTTEKLFNMLKKIDDTRAKNIDSKNPVRLIRAIEISKALGKVPIVQKGKPYETLVIGVDVPNEILKKKISLRVQKRMKQGMLKEAINLHKKGVSWKRMKSFGLEYGLLADLAQKKISKKDFLERLEIEIWQYVKRQRKWFARRDDIHWYTPHDIQKIYRSVSKFIKNHSV